MARRRKKRFRMQPRFFLVLVTILGVIIIVLLLIKKVGGDSAEVLEATAVPTATLAPTATPDPALPDDVAVTRSDSANPNNYGMKGTISANGNDTTSYSRTDSIFFGRDIEYSALPGILTFGGNSYRDTFTYGTATVTEKRLRQQWSKTIGSIGNWSGTGWTGQPLIVEWPAETVAVMNVKDSYKETGEPLTEVIYPAMDGNIYFLDLETGDATRDPIATGVVQKGTSCIDPRGYPLLFVGQGIPTENDQGNNAAYVRVYSLITGEEIYRFGGFDWFSRRTWQAYDSSPIISDDTIVYAGENGVLYTSKLNAEFDVEAGTVTIDPERLVKMRYEGSGYSRSDATGSRWYGVESSVAAFRNYAFFTDNGGRLQCVDLNTMKLKYVVDVTDDTDASVVIEESYDDSTIYLYTGSEVKTANGDLGDGYGYSYQRKINGLTGEVVWEQQWICSTGDDTTSGGILATPHVGKYQISDLVIYSFSFAAQSNGTVSTDTADGDAEADDTESETQSAAVPVADENGNYSVGGRIVALDKSTGAVVWSVEQENDYWSSPVVVYDEQGKAYLIQCDRGGYATLYDAATGTELNSIDLGSRIDSTPAVFNNMLVVGTRGKGGSGDTPKIVCVKIS